MKKRIVRRIIYIVSVIVLLFIIAGASAVIWYQASLNPVDSNKCVGTDCATISFKVDKNSSAATIADNLEKAGIIKSALAFRIYLTLQAPNKNLLPGNYDLAKDMSVEEIIKALNEGVVAKTVTLMFLPGETLRATRKKFVDAGFSEAEVDKALDKKYDHKLFASKPADASLEGYIWGDTYEFYASDPVEKDLVKIFDEMYRVIEKEGLEAKYQARGLTLHQGITLASIVQREAPSDYQEKRHVAQVFETRYQRGIPLGSDAIIAYRADQLNPNRDKTDMSYLTTIGCPWNSRRCKGLPPSPISAPGINALKSVAEPTDTDDLYFLTGDDGKMYYAKTEAAHNENARKYCKQLCKIL